MSPILINELPTTATEVTVIFMAITKVSPALKLDKLALVAIVEVEKKAAEPVPLVVLHVTKAVPEVLKIVAW